MGSRRYGQISNLGAIIATAGGESRQFMWFGYAAEFLCSGKCREHKIIARAKFQERQTKQDLIRTSWSVQCDRCNWKHEVAGTFATRIFDEPVKSPVAADWAEVPYVPRT